MSEQQWSRFWKWGWRVYVGRNRIVHVYDTIEDQARYIREMVFTGREDVRRREEGRVLIIKQKVMVIVAQQIKLKTYFPKKLFGKEINAAAEGFQKQVYADTHNKWQRNFNKGVQSPQLTATRKKESAADGNFSGYSEKATKRTV